MFGRGKKGGGVVRRVRGMGGALLGVVRAEISALVSDLSASGQSLVRSLVIFAFGFAFAFWTLGLLVYFLIELLTLKLARWGAVGIVFGVFLVTAVALVAWALSRLKGIESPVRTVERRVQDHLAWWQQRVAGPAAAGIGAAAGVAGATGRDEDDFEEIEDLEDDEVEEEDYP